MNEAQTTNKDVNNHPDIRLKNAKKVAGALSSAGFIVASTVFSDEIINTMAKIQEPNPLSILVVAIYAIAFAVAVHYRKEILEVLNTEPNGTNDRTQERPKLIV
jgi:hypothetical protein